MIIFTLLCAFFSFLCIVMSDISSLFVCYAIWSVGLFFFEPPKHTKISIAVTLAVLIRLLFVGTDPILSDDIYRYLWEGKLWMAGGNPYIQPPNTFAMDDLFLQDPFLQKVNHPHIPSVYPPVAMWLFGIFSLISYSTWFYKIMFVCFDIGVLYLLSKILSNRQKLPYIWLYALHPLPILENASSGHLDIMGVFFVILAMWFYKAQQKQWGGFFVMIGGGIKLLPFSLTPLFGWKGGIGGVLGLVLIAILGMPMWQSAAFEGLQTYLEHWSFNGFLYPMFHHFFPTHSRIILLILWICTICTSLFWFKNKEKQDVEIAILWIFGIWFLCSPTAHPWYALWIFPFAILCQSRYWTLLCSLLPLSYHALLTIDPQTHHWNPSIWPQIIEYTLPFLILLFPTISKRFYNPWRCSVEPEQISLSPSQT